VRIGTYPNNGTNEIVPEKMVVIRMIGKVDIVGLKQLAIKAHVVSVIGGQKTRAIQQAIFHLVAPTIRTLIQGAVAAAAAGTRVGQLDEQQQ